jgi:hypothetical protein
VFALRILLRTLFLQAAFSIFSTAHAGEPPEASQMFQSLDYLKGRIEFDNGLDVTSSGWSGYGTLVLGLARPLAQDGWRLKLFGAQSRYGYDTRDRTICQKIHDVGQTDPNPVLDEICDSIVNNPPEGDERERITAALDPYGLALDGDRIVAIVPHQVTRTQLAAAPGYRASFGRLIVKTYLGLGYEHEKVTPPDAGKAVSGSVWGAQAWVEAWLPLGECFWLSADGAYFTGASRYSADMKFGFAALDWLAFGPELAAFGEEDDASGRAGAFLRLDAAGMETTIAGGISGAYRDDPSAYGSASVHMKF